MGEFTERIAEELFVNLLHFGIVVGLAQLASLVFLVNGAYTLHPDLIGGHAGLSAAADAAAKAGHDLDEVVGGFAAANLLNEVAGVAEIVGHDDLRRDAFEEGLSGVHLMPTDAQPVHLPIGNRPFL